MTACPKPPPREPKVRRKRDTTIRRWALKVRLPEIPNGSWEWLAAKDDGYGQFRSDRKTKAHRYGYERFVGPIPAGLVLDHLCRNPGCVNPGHLEAVTDRENTLRGETLPATHAKRTHCPLGHPYAGDNLVIPRSGRFVRRCRVCRTASNRKAKSVFNARKRSARAQELKDGP